VAGVVERQVVGKVVQVNPVHEGSESGREV